MLRPLIFQHLFLFLTFLCPIEPIWAKEKPLDFNQTRNPDLSWVKDMDFQAKELSKTYQKDARRIVNKASQIAFQGKSCEAAQTLADQAKNINRKSLTIGDEGQITRYPQLLVFVSFSMPVETLKSLAFQVSQVCGTLVLRGLVKGNIKDTIEKLKELQREIMIDPTLFEAYGIKAVPTFTLRQKPTDTAEETVFHDRLMGNVSLEYALEQFSSQGILHLEAAQMLRILRKNR